MGGENMEKVQLSPQPPYNYVPPRVVDLIVSPHIPIILKKFRIQIKN